MKADLIRLIYRSNRTRSAILTDSGDCIGMTIAVRPASPHTGAGLFALLPPCCAPRRLSGTTAQTARASRLFNCTSPRGQSSASAAGIAWKSLRPRQCEWPSFRAKMPCAVIKRTTRHLVTTESDAAAAPSATVADAAVVSSRTEAEGVVAEKQLEPTLPSTKRQRLERIIQYTFKDDDYFQASIHHDLKLGHHLVERVQLQLAIIGDSLIKMIWYAEVFPFPDPRKIMWPSTKHDQH